MRWSVPIGSILGIRVYLHVTLLLLLGAIGWYVGQRLGWVNSVAAMGISAAFFAIILLHELGHSVAAMAYGVRVQSITLLPIGGVAAMAYIPEQPLKEFVIAVAGPLVNLLLAVAATFYLGSWPTWGEIFQFHDTSPGLVRFFQLMNIRLLLFNLLPGFPMDGGRILRAALAAVMDFTKATTVAVWIGRLVAIVFMLSGAKSFMYPAIGVFIFMAGSGEHRLVSLRSRLRGRTASDIMRPLQTSLSPRQRLADLIDLAARSPQQDYVVIDEGRVVGLLPEEVWCDAVRHRFDNPPIGDLMVTRFVCVHGFAQLSRLFQDQRSIDQSCFPVVDGGEIRGVVLRADIARAAAEPVDRTPDQPTAPRRPRLTIDLG